RIRQHVPALRRGRARGGHRAARRDPRAPYLRTVPRAAAGLRRLGGGHLEVAAPELQRPPRRRRRQLEERTATRRFRVGELAALVLPDHREEPFLHAVVEVRAAEDELAEP